MPRPSIWSDPEKIRLLKLLHAEGVTSRTIAHRLGTSRSSVVAKLWRLAGNGYQRIEGPRRSSGHWTEDRLTARWKDRPK